MKTAADLSELWQTYFLNTPKKAGNDAWAITFMARDGRGLLVSLADPYHEESEDVFVSDVQDGELATFVRYYKQHFRETLPARFGFFRPEVDRVLTEYPDWQGFYSAWLHDDPTLVQGNMPLLFDFPGAPEYRAMQLKGADHAGYRRLLVVLYQYRKQQFQRVFIQGVDDTAYGQIRTQITTLYDRTLPRLILSEPQTATRG